MIPLPNLRAVLVNKLGNIVSPWNSYLQQFTQAPPSVIDIIVGPSIFSYSALEPGTIVISGGTIVAINLIRGTVTIPLAITDRIIPVGINDTVQVNYSAPITMKFLPSYGQKTG